ncbi:MAG: polyphosphate kinase 2 family protein [Planctomycetaceae bacterium]
MPSPKTIADIIDRFRVPPGEHVRLKDFDSAWAGDKKQPKKERRKFAEDLLADDASSLELAQELLYAANSWSILIIFQAMDAAGKDSTIKHVMSGVNPQGVQVFSFKHPSAEELEHNFLWRCSRALPERGRIGIFNRSYYEEVLIVRVHPELVTAQRTPEAKIGKTFWADRFEDINNFERHLTRNGTVILKFFLNLSWERQRQRFLDRVNDPNKHWKFSTSDLAERACWDKYIEAYEDALSATSTAWAPWYAIPADHKWVTRALVARIVAKTVDSLELKYPEVTPEKLKEIQKAKRQLEAEET